ncbi:tubulin-tyrosine ligase family protein [Nitzschia inconspicua]|uniref:Tubulin-tyrosine ligase family protein n=1 Tax=Nitzschia inconspicua TaxID=303405 RepID=A0A9K3K9L3_9STRA|nr:tubulin-tyrosine ligase family protein [Nitzschia inconspicua]KAG7362464.1 tubulin-tyrosine ligase family protein [Nitzschia inconspicua]
MRQSTKCLAVWVTAFAFPGSINYISGLLTAFITKSPNHQRRQRRRSRQISCPIRLSVSSTSSFIDTTTSFNTTEKILFGLAASQKAATNITAAMEACDIWDDIFRKDEQDLVQAEISPQVIQLSRTLHASCLVRIGRDSEAIPIYDYCINKDCNCSSSKNENNLSLEANHNKHIIAVAQWRLSKAKCHQRLLDYSQAFMDYRDVLEEETISNVALLEQALQGAVTCALRLGNVTLAQEIFPIHHDTFKIPSPDTACLAAVIRYLHSGDRNGAVERLRSSVQQNWFLYQWILSVLQSSSENDDDNRMSDFLPISSSSTAFNETFLQLIRINMSPFDDPDLVYLDDKINLHDLLTTHSNLRSTETMVPFWPDGIILPRELNRLKEMLAEQRKSSSTTRRTTTNDDIMDNSLWILKSRAGYGSHGNQILTLSQALSKYDDRSTGGKEASNELSPVLLQRMVHPLYLLSGHKFSLRIFVVYFTLDEIYISTKGLVKLAAEPLHDHGDDDANPELATNARKHMTNSGRETSMVQYGLDFLWDDLGETRATKVWQLIRDVTSNVWLLQYPLMVTNNMQNNPMDFSTFTARRQSLGIPKILGFDFVLQNDNGELTPFLVEVNRFPGMEPRDAVDYGIKHQVVRDAWIQAAKRMDSTRSKGYVSHFVTSIPVQTSESSLQKLVLSNIDSLPSTNY